LYLIIITYFNAAPNDRRLWLVIFSLLIATFLPAFGFDWQNELSFQSDVGLLLAIQALNSRDFAQIGNVYGHHCHSTVNFNVSLHVRINKISANRETEGVNVLSIPFLVAIFCEPVVVLSCLIHSGDIDDSRFALRICESIPESQECPLFGCKPYNNGQDSKASMPFSLPMPLAFMPPL